MTYTMQLAGFAGFVAGGTMAWLAVYLYLKQTHASERETILHMLRSAESTVENLNAELKATRASLTSVRNALTSYDVRHEKWRQPAKRSIDDASPEEWDELLHNG